MNPMIPTQFTSRIIANGRIAEGFYEMSLLWEPDGTRAPAPGQFLTLGIGGGASALLRRPFAFAGLDEAANTVSIIYQKRGRGTELLSAMRAGETIDVIGPLGVSFDDSVINKVDMVAHDNADFGKHVIVAGGVGIGPMLFLLSTLKSRGISAQFVFGCRNSNLILDTKLFTDANPRICTDDGSAGFRGTAANYIKANVSLGTNTTIYACGPTPMLRSVNEMAQAFGAKCLVSIEAVMACGVGACMGCVVPVAGGGYSRVCKEGPVFDGKDIQWELM